MPGADAAELARRAAALAAQDREHEAAALFDEALARYPGDARLANSAGNFHARRGDNALALTLFERALRLRPDIGEAAINAAIVLLRMGRARSAEEILAPHQQQAREQPQFWSLRAESAKGLGDFAAADGFLRRAEACSVSSARVRKARARLSLERGEARAIADYEEALTQAPGDFDLMHGYALALHAGGRSAEALDFARSLADHFPSWIGGQSALAELRWEAGEGETYTSHFEAAAAAHPAPETYLEWARLLAGDDRHHAAADVLQRALRLWPDDLRLRLDFAVELGEAGDAQRAAELLGAPDAVASADWSLARARNDLRLGRIEPAAAGLEALAAANIADVAAWSLLDVCWRLNGDPRHDWLHGQPGLVRELALPLEEEQVATIRRVLGELHAASAIPLAQSVKSGTQTRGALFARLEPELALLKDALGTVLTDYRRGLPPADATHPLLSRRDDPWLIAGSWSVRFSGRGRHAAHIHPRGLLSSACYFIVPDEVEAAGTPGWLELGRPPEGIAPQLPPLFDIKPREGMCALFPSTLFHGTRPIEAGERMTVAFDVAPEPV